MTYTAIIVEDNPVDAEILSDYLNKYFPEIIIVAAATSVAATKKMILQHSPQIVFMDIELTDGKSIEILDSFNTENVQLIFTTSHDVFAIDAIRANAVDYIIKPIDAVLLKKAVLKAFQRIEERHTNKTGVLVHKISIPTADGLTYIAIEKILRIEADGNYAKIVLEDGKTHFVTRPLAHFEKELPANLFMRVHNSYLVNRNFITDFIKTKTGSIKMQDGFICQITAGQKEQVLNWMEGR